MEDIYHDKLLFKAFIKLRDFHLLKYDIKYKMSLIRKKRI